MFRRAHLGHVAIFENQDDGQLAAELVETKLGDVKAVNDNLALGRLNESEESQGEGGLAGSSAANNTNSLPAIDISRDVVEHKVQALSVASAVVLQRDLPGLWPAILRLHILLLPLSLGVNLAVL